MAVPSTRASPSRQAHYDQLADTVLSIVAEQLVSEGGLETLSVPVAGDASERAERLGRERTHPREKWCRGIGSRTTRTGRSVSGAKRRSVCAGQIRMVWSEVAATEEEQVDAAAGSPTGPIYVTPGFASASKVPLRI